MELHMQSHHFEARVPDWPAAVVAGFVAGAILMVLELIWAVLIPGDSPWIVSHKIAAIVLGPGTLQSNDFSIGVVALALATHYVLGIAFGIILAAIIAPFHFDSSAGMLVLVGAVFGALIYLFDFYVMEQVFRWFADMRGWETFVAHLIFGIAAALMYWQLERSREVPAR